MQRDKLEVLLTLRDEATGKLGKASEAVKNHSATFRKAAIGMGVAAGILGSALTFAARAGRDQSNALDALEGAVTRAGGDYGELEDNINDLLESTTDFTNYTKTDAAEALGILIANLGDVPLAMAALPGTIDRAAQAGVSVETAARNMSNAVTKGGGEMAETIDGLGEALLATEDKFERIEIATDEVRGAAEENADALKVFMSTLNDIAVKLGIWEILTGIVESLSGFVKAINLSDGALKVLGKTLAITFVALTVGGLVAGLLAIGAAVGATVLIIGAGVAIFAGMMGIVAVKWDEWVLAYSRGWETIKFQWSNGWNGLWAFVSGIVGPIVNVASSIWGGIASGLETVGLTIIGVWDWVWDRVEGAISTAAGIITGIFNGIMATIQTVIDIAKNPGSLIPKISGALGGVIGAITPFAAGGIVTSPTLALIGEAGPEAVVPLGAGGGIGGTVNVILPSSSLLVMTDDAAVERFTSSLVTGIRQQLRRQHGF